MGLFEQTITDIVINLLFVQPLNECIQCLFRARAFLLLMQLKQFYVFFILISVPNDESLFLSHGHISYSLSTLLLCVCTVHARTQCRSQVHDNRCVCVCARFQDPPFLSFLLLAVAQPLYYTDKSVSDEKYFFSCSFNESCCYCFIHYVDIC